MPVRSMRGSQESVLKCPCVMQPTYLVPIQGALDQLTDLLKDALLWVSNAGKGREAGEKYLRCTALSACL